MKLIYAQLCFYGKLRNSSAIKRFVISVLCASTPHSIQIVFMAELIFP